MKIYQKMTPLTLLCFTVLLLASCSDEEKKQPTAEADRPEKPAMAPGVKPEEFLEAFNRSQSDSRKIKDDILEGLEFKDGVAKTQGAFGDKGRLYLAVNEEDHRLVAVKLSGTMEMKRELAASLLRAFHPEGEEEALSKHLDELKVDSDEKELNTRSEWDSIQSSHHRTEPGWALILSRADRKKAVYDNKVYVPQKKTVEKKKEEKKPEKEEPENKRSSSGNGGVTVVSNPSSVTVLVNKTHKLPDGYIPPDLYIPDVRFPYEENLPKKKMRGVAAEALERLFAAADKQGITLYAQSGYRSYERQEAIFAYKSSQMGEEKASQISARPGHSEHQTGLAMDITSRSVGFKLEQSFGRTKEGQWVARHAHEFGFIIRYPQGKEHITGYSYEPWHLRYVGPRVAAEIHRNNLTLEEYLD
ncbi:M15 family metallopeptidase [Melghirimyces profundicolus]